MTGITPADLSARLRAETDELYVLDVQPIEDFERWHVPGSKNLDIADELRNDPEAARTALRTIPEKEVVVTCTAGEASKLAIEFLHDMGYDVKSLACHYP